MIALSRLAVCRFLANLLRLSVCASLQNSLAFKSASICSFASGSIGGSSYRGAGTAFIGFSILNSRLAQVKKAQSATQALRTLFAERGWSLPEKRRGLYSVRNQAMWFQRSCVVTLPTSTSSPMWDTHRLRRCS